MPMNHSKASISTLSLGLLSALVAASCSKAPTLHKGSTTSTETGDDGIKDPAKPVAGDGDQEDFPGEADADDSEPASTYVDPGVAAPLPDPNTKLDHQFFKITLIDSHFKLPITGATLTTTNNIVLTTDRNGVAAFYEPGLMGTKVYFTIAHPGWTGPVDGFGHSGTALDVKEGGSAEVLMTGKSGQQLTISSDLQTRLAAGKVPTKNEIFGLRIIDSKTKRGVPLIWVKGSNGLTYHSDNQGYVAFDDIDNIGKEIQFDVSSDGYNSTTAKLATTKGKISTIEIERRNIAERLYRSTGAGSYRDSILLGLSTPVKQPSIDGLVMGQDTLNAIVYKGKSFWIWQDTSSSFFHLGNFGNSGAMADLPGKGNISQDLGINRTYFVADNGFSRAMTPGFEPAGQPTWMGGLVVVPDAAGNEKMLGIYGKAESLAGIGKKGWGVYDDASNTFKDLEKYAKAEFIPGQSVMAEGDGVPVRHGNKDYLYWGYLRAPATYESILNYDNFEAYTPYEAKSKTLRKKADGSLDYQWTKNAYPPNAEELVKAGVKKDQTLDEFNFSDAEGKNIAIASGSLERNWNEYRKRYIGTIQQKFGTSFLGESWISEADTPMGPWNFATKIISHDRYTFYNLQQHPHLDQEGGRLIYIHGTYTNFFTSEPATPRHDYNQVLYRLDLSDARVAMPVALYDLGGSAARLASKADLHRDSGPLSASFFAKDKNFSGSVPFSWSAPECDSKRVLVPSKGRVPAFYALPASTAANDGLIALYEFKSSKGDVRYSTEAAIDGYTKGTSPIAQVWKTSTHVPINIGDYLGDLAAHAGSDLCLSAGPGNASMATTLDGSLSSSLSSKIVSYNWMIRGETSTQKLEGIRPSATLAAGLYHVELTVKDETGRVSKDRMMLQIKN